MKALIIFVLLVAGITPQPTASDSCLVWNNNDGVCEQCLEGFYLVFYLCFPCSPLCTCSSSQNYCESCVSYQIDSQLQISLEAYREGDVCKFCNTSITHCLTCESKQICLTCFSGRYLTNQSLCSENVCVQKCQICENEFKCSKCFLGYAVADDGSCVRQDCTPNCTHCLNGTQCSKCIDTYYLSEGVCSQCMSDCLKCTSNDSCLACFPGFYFYNGTCQNTQMSNCVLYNGTISSPVCLACEPGFYISGGSCSQCSGCYLCSQAFICLSECTAGNVPFNFACISWQWFTRKWGYMLPLILIFILWA